jgi:hypothetical protein
VLKIKGEIPYFCTKREFHGSFQNGEAEAMHFG